MAGPSCSPRRLAMSVKLFGGLAVLLGLAGAGLAWTAWGTSHTGCPIAALFCPRAASVTTDCCAPGSDCCYPGSPCCGDAATAAAEPQCCSQTDEPAPVVARRAAADEKAPVAANLA